MVFLIILALVAALLVFPHLVYYVWMHNEAEKSWDIKIDNCYQPTVTLIIPTYNEAAVIGKKLENTQRIDYPEDKLQVILVDSASTESTLSVCKDFLEKNKFRFPIRLLSEGKRKGKSHALNTALKYAKGEIIAISDADSFWEPNVLNKCLPFFADPSIGAVTGREKLINLKQSVHTRSEGLYRKFYYTLRLGESKIHSTLIFQGELSLYRRSVLEKFEDRAGYSDDTGTVINIVSRGYRCIFLPQAVFHDTSAYSLRGKLMLKSRRAQHLVSGIIWSLKLKVQGKLPLSPIIILSNFYMHIISPLLLISTAFLFIIGLPMFWYLIPIATFLLLFEKSRLLVISYLTSNLALIIGLFHHFLKRKEYAWRKIEEMREI